MTVAAFIQDEQEIVWILAGLDLRVDECLVARRFSFLNVAKAPISQSLPRHLSISRSIVLPPSVDLLNGVIGGARCGKK